jgi:formate C-acetyltransferase
MDRINILKEQYDKFGFREFYGWPGWYRAPLEPEEGDFISYESINFDEPIPIRRAKILNEIMRKMKVFIKPEELIVGHFMSKGLSHRLYPEYLSETERQTIHRVGPVNHVIADYAKVINLGMMGIKAEIQQRMGGEIDEQKLTFLRSADLALDAGIILGQRYAEEARRLAVVEADERRRGELLRIADICDRVPKYSARTFYEALQAVWFTQILLVTEVAGCAVDAHTLGRFDQYVYPFYQRDLQAGRITEAEALELIECLFIKYCEKEVQGGELFVIGGMSPPPPHSPPYTGGKGWEEGVHGKDATNPISYLCLEAFANLKLPAPKLMARVFSGTPQRFYEKCLEVISTGLGSPALYNDEVAIPALTRNSIPLEEARDYAPIGCYELCLPGREYGNPMACHINLPKCLEWALSNGEGIIPPPSPPSTGGSEGGGAPTGDISTFNSFESVLTAYKRQVEFQVSRQLQAVEAYEKMCALSTPSPLLSALMADCIDNATDISAGGARYNFRGCQGYGLANVADSLAVIKKVVYEEGEMSLSELVGILENNFADYEEVRQKFINRIPKYGNDDDYVDSIAVEIAQHFCETVSNIPLWRGGVNRPGLFSFLGNVWGGVSALPDGTLKGERLAQNMAATPGATRNGPTAEVKSVAKIDYTQAANGTAFNLRFHPQVFKTEDGKQKIICLTKTLFQMGGMHVQFNVVDQETLKDAQKHPEKYRDLIVRVTGYSARFIDEPVEIQNNIIAQAEYVL